MKPVRTIEFAHAVPLDGRGHRLADTTLAIDERDRWLAQAAALYMPGQSSRAAALRLRVALARYREGAWRRQRVEDQCPGRLRGRIEQFCWLILRSRDHVPSERVIRRALDGARGGLT
ncbi:hypothetical protein [Bradyrhizobium sp. DASA03120]|uniref:hypothetical protein n=1 Tax=Bradyrhizobium sp. SMVTL-02 TaxID=3395917 RepID=UPI003F6EFE5A